MHILETYALMSGCKIDKCFIEEEEITLPHKKYITFHPFSPKGNSKQYDKWHEVLGLLRNNTQFEYYIIQIGGQNDVRYNVVDTSYLGQTNYHSLAFLIKNSALHLGFDSLPIHLASYYDKKIVGLYPYYIANCGPYFSSKENVRLFEPNFSNVKPVFGYNDHLRLINTIDPAEIYRSVIELLGVA